MNHRGHIIVFATVCLLAGSCLFEARDNRSPVAAVQSIAPTPIPPSGSDGDVVQRAGGKKDPGQIFDRTAYVTLMQSYCLRCHGENGQGGLSSITDVEIMIERKLLVPGDAEKSTLLARIKDLSMPTGSEKVSREEAVLFEGWIKDGMPGAVAALLPLVDPTGNESFVSADVKKLRDDGISPDSMRYLILAQSMGETGGKTFADGLASLRAFLNSLSWKPSLAPISTVSKDLGIVRINLDDFGLTAANWDQMAALYPYKQGIGRGINVPASPAPPTAPGGLILRADWLVRQASKPVHYHALLQLPATLPALETLVGIKFADQFLASLAGDRQLWAAGFLLSGVSEYNRVVYRSATPAGAFWKSSDFASNNGVKNIFTHPVGPKALVTSGFEEDGGEMIFSLPNGLQAYFLANAAGTRLDVAPTNIVFDKERSQAVENGYSCMGCHGGGIIPKNDQILAAIGNSDTRLPLIYSSVATMQSKMKEDNERYGAAVRSCGSNPALGRKTMLLLADDFDKDIAFNRLSLELGLRPEQLRKAIPALGDRFRSTMILLEAKVIKLKRSDLEAVFNDLALEIFAILGVG